MNEDIRVIVLGNAAGKKTQGRTVYGMGGVSPTLCAGMTHGNTVPYVFIEEKEEMYRIRKLTPSECFKLMGFDYADADRLAEAGISNTQLYKMAGNSIVVPCLEGIFKEIYKNEDQKEN